MQILSSEPVTFSSSPLPQHIAAVCGSPILRAHAAAVVHTPPATTSPQPSEDGHSQTDELPKLSPTLRLQYASQMEPRVPSTSENSMPVLNSSITQPEPQTVGYLANRWNHGGHVPLALPAVDRASSQTPRYVWLYLLPT